MSRTNYDIQMSFVRNQKRAEKHGAVIDGTVTEESIALIYEDEECIYCGKTVEEDKRSLDHIFPMCRGGKHSVTNLAMSCVKCNQKKANFTYREMVIIGNDKKKAKRFQTKVQQITDIVKKLRFEA